MSRSLECNTPKPRLPVDEKKREGWVHQGVLVIDVTDARLTWTERELVKQLAERLYGKRIEDLTRMNGV